MPSFVLSIARLPVAALVAALVYTGGAAGANAQDLDPQTRERLAAMREGDLRKLNLHHQARPAPADAFLDPEGREQHLADSDGKVRLVNFWATWCAPCRQEKPALDRLAAELEGEPFEVIPVAVGRHDLEAIERFNAEVGVEHLATYLDPESALAASAGVVGLPVTLLLNREGQEIGRLLGAGDWDSDSARAIVRSVIDLGTESGTEEESASE